MINLNKKRIFFMFILIMLILISNNIVNDRISNTINQSAVLISKNIPLKNSNLSSIYSCINELEYNSNISIWTMLTDDDNYALSAIKLLKSIKQNVDSIKFDSIILELKEKPLKENIKAMLSKEGWSFCVIDRIKPRDEENTLPRFRDQFSKLILWNMTEYKSLLYFDSDTFVIKNINNLLNSFQYLNDSLRIGCTRDIRSGKWQSTFNMGIFTIKPNKTEYERLIRLKDDQNLKFETKMSEQGFLNVVYQNQWYDFGFIYNANLAVYSELNNYWREYENNISVIHYTIKKPWACSNKYKIVCDKWRLFKTN